MPAKMRILAADDDATALGALRQALTHRGYDVVAVPNGQEALAWLSRETADLVILDVGMPGLSGYDVCRRIREDPRLASVPVIFLTAKSLGTDVAEGQEAGSDVYLVKPVLASRLVTTVEVFLAKDGPSKKSGTPVPG